MDEYFVGTSLRKHIMALCQMLTFSFYNGAMLMDSHHHLVSMTQVALTVSPPIFKCWCPQIMQILNKTSKNQNVYVCVCV